MRRCWKASLTQLGAVAAELRDRRGAGRGDRGRRRHHRAGADARRRCCCCCSAPRSSRCWSARPGICSRNSKLLIDFTFPLLSSLLIYLTLVFTNFVKEQAQRRQIRSAFGQYLSPTLVEQLAQSPEKLVLGGEARDMTIMFSDVRGFTTISEIYKDDPQGLTALMNSFLTPLTNAIIDRNGTIDKYMGDAIMAFWNAPLDDPAHELNACEAALDMLERVERLNREREAGGRGQRHAVHSDQHRRRHQHRPLRRRQHGLRPALRLFGAGRQRQSRLAPGRPVQILRRCRSSSARKTAQCRQGQIRASSNSISSR